MSEIVEMPARPAVPAAAAASKPAPKLNAIQIIEQEIQNFERQRQQHVANVHAAEGAIQASQHLLNRLKAEAAKAEAEVGVVADSVAVDGLKVAEKVVEVATQEKV